MKYSKKNNQGFTLVELSIVLIVIGLIVGGLIVGSSIVRTAKLQTLIKDIQQYQTIIGQFKQQYGYFPGDHPNGVAIFGAASNGNGDGKVNVAADPYGIQWAINEQLITWQEMSKAGLLDVNYTGSGATIQPGVNVPKTINGAGINFGPNTSSIFDVEFYYSLNVGSGGTATTVVGYQMGGFLSPNDAFSIDKKLDDGVGITGSVVIASGHSSTVTCSSVAPSYYSLAVTGSGGGTSNKVCALSFRLLVNR